MSKTMSKVIDSRDINNIGRFKLYEETDRFSERSYIVRDDSGTIYGCGSSPEKALGIAEENLVAELRERRTEITKEVNAIDDIIETHLDEGLFIKDTEGTKYEGPLSG